jgi:hypothetical protein
VVTLGTHNYTQSQLLQIYNQPVQGNGLVALAHQLITARLNLPDDPAVQGYITAADALIGNLVVPPIGNGYLPTSQTSTLNNLLDTFNNSKPSNCQPVPKSENTKSNKIR